MWRSLLAPVARGKVVPIIGPRLLEAAHGPSHETALRLAGAHHCPMAAHEWDDLPRVTEYMGVKESTASSHDNTAQVWNADGSSVNAGQEPRESSGELAKSIAV